MRGPAAPQTILSNEDDYPMLKAYGAPQSRAKISANQLSTRRCFSRVAG
jgi:hypothetical protein